MEILNTYHFLIDMDKVKQTTRFTRLWLGTYPIVARCCRLGVVACYRSK
ncbi:hypothetical protein [Niallia sp. Marseille-Q9988]